MRNMYILAATLALFNWSINKAHAFPSPSPPSATSPTIHRHSSFRDVHLDSRQIRNADYSSNNPSPPGLYIKPESEAAPNSQPHPPASQGTPSAPQTADSKDGKTKAARASFFDAHDTGATAKRGVERKRWLLAPGEPADAPSANSRLDSRQSYTSRAPRKIDGGWWMKRQDTIHNARHSLSSDDVVRAPKASRAAGEKSNDRGVNPILRKGAPASPLEMTPDAIASNTFPELAPQSVTSRSMRWSERDVNFMESWDKLARPHTVD